jgi:hypothetical protein
LLTALRMTNWAPCYLSYFAGRDTTGNHPSDFVGEIREDSLDKVKIFQKLRMALFVWFQRAAKSYVFCQQDWNTSKCIAELPYLTVRAFDRRVQARASTCMRNVGRRAVWRAKPARVRRACRAWLRRSRCRRSWRS